jgi:DNA-binding transcriptional ArsR family regulator
VAMINRAHLDNVFAALADPTRRAILARLAEGDATVSELAAPFGLRQPTISKHLRVLEDAGLISQGRDAQRRPRALVVGGPLQAVDGWLAPFREQWEARFDRLEALLEKAAMTKMSIDRDTFTITFQRMLRASRNDVFDAWTQPEQLAQWWDPTGVPLAKCAVDLRVAGTFYFENQGHSPPFHGVYRVIERPAKLVFEALGAVGTVTLETDGRATRMQVSIRCPSADHLAQFVKLGVDVNTARTLDNLGALVDTKAA